MNPFLSTSKTYDTKNVIINNKGIKYGYTVTVPNFCPFENMPSRFDIVTKTPVDIFHLKNRKIGSSFNKGHFGIVYRCQSCHKYCLFDYAINIDEAPEANSRAFIIYSHFKRKHLNLSFSYKELDNLDKISPNFKNIYIEAVKAEHFQLNEIDKMAYRKALEFLVDGFVKNFQHKSLKRTLSENINLMKDADMINAAKLASWIGNDGTHPDTKNPQLDISDLKRCLSAVGHFILYKITARNAEKYINNHYKK